MMRNQQKGGIFTGLLVLMSIGFLAFLASRVVPPFIEFLSVKSALSTMKSSPNVVEAKTNSLVKTAALEVLQRNLDINQVKSVQKDNIRFTNQRNSLMVTVKYPVQVKLFANMDLLIHFEDSTVIDKHDE